MPVFGPQTQTAQEIIKAVERDAVPPIIDDKSRVAHDDITDIVAQDIRRPLHIGLGVRYWTVEESDDPANTRQGCWIRQPLGYVVIFHHQSKVVQRHVQQTMDA